MRRGGARMSTEGPAATRGQLCTFTLAGHHFGVPVGRVQEVIRHQEMTAVPLAPPLVRGLINLRGQIVTALDLRQPLDLPPAPPGARPTNVVVRAGADLYSLLVDEIGDVIEVGADAFEPPPDTLTGRCRDLIRGAFKLDARLLLLLDTDRLLAL
ncbi:chemotaxis protein CheW [Frigoriglobus tundricola]